MSISDLKSDYKPYKCERCNTSFRTKNDVVRHFKNRTKVPCDRVCVRCGLKMYSDRTFLRHIDNPCEPMYNEPSVIVENVVSNANNNSNNTIANSIVGNNNNNVSVVINNANNNSNNNVIALDEIKTFYISRMGILPIEQEQNMLLDKHTRALDKLFTNHIQQVHLNKDANTDENLKTMLLTIIELFHSNKRYPEFMNIVEGDSEMDFNLVYSATEFVNDVMPKLIRNKRVIQLILDQLERFLKIGTNTPQLLHFIRDIFIPYIYKLYKYDNIPPEIQMCWKNNKRILEMIDYRQFPTFPRETITYDKMDQQFSDYYSKDARIMEKIFELNIKNMEKIRRDSMRRVIMEGVNLAIPPDE